MQDRESAIMRLPKKSGKDQYPRMSNRLQYETSPYLLQHAENPVDWYPWGEEAFENARVQDKPVFLSIGYSTCHWCHVMAHESFEDEKIAALLNKHFISIKVDKEERPDIDSIYMSVCQAFTGGGGWPTSIFMTPEQKPFFAGTYFPKTTRRGMTGFEDILTLIHEKWETDREGLLRAAESIVAALSETEDRRGETDERLLSAATELFKRSYDAKCGGFGSAPKFPTPHNLLFLMERYEKTGDEGALLMAETSLRQMYRGGLFDHIGFGFSRYSTDRRFLVPHFEKMLYDNALLMLAYAKAYALTKKPLYLTIAEKTASYVLREMRSPQGGFYSAQDADSEGVEGKYYLFTPREVIKVLGKEEGEAFNRRYDVTEGGNFEGKNIPNLLKTEDYEKDFEPKESLCALYAYRRQRNKLHLDDKILTAWNSLMIAAMCALYRASGNAEYLHAAQSAQSFVEERLSDGDALYVSFRGERRGKKGFLDDYAAYIFALIMLYEATLESAYLQRAVSLCEKAIALFSDGDRGGFYLYGEENEALILRPKESYDGAIPSGNSLMAYDLVRLYHITQDEVLGAAAERQMAYMCAQAKDYPAGYAFFLLALSAYLDPPERITIVPAPGEDMRALPCKLPADAALYALEAPTRDYPLKNDKTTFYLCREHSCRPPVNDLSELEA